MKLLLDEMWPHAVADALCQRGHDVVAVTALPDLRGKSDEEIVEAALAEGRGIVTENAVDYRPLMAVAMSDGRDFPLLILTSNRRWPRANPGTAGRLVAALDALLTADDALEGEHWL